MASNYPTDYQSTMNAVNTGINAAGAAAAPSTGGLSIPAAMITTTIINVVGGILQGLGQERVKQPVPFTDKERAYWYDYYNRLAKRRDRAVHFATMALGAEPGTFDYDIDEGFKQTLNEYYNRLVVSTNEAVMRDLLQDPDYINASDTKRNKMLNALGISKETETSIREPVIEPKSLVSPGKPPTVIVQEELDEGKVSSTSGLTPTEEEHIKADSPSQANPLRDEEDRKDFMAGG